VVFDLFFEKQRYKIWTYVFVFLDNFALKYIKFEKCLRINFEQS